MRVIIFSIFIDSLIALLNLIISFNTKQSLLSTSVVGGAGKRGPRWIHTHLHSPVSPFKSRVKAQIGLLTHYLPITSIQTKPRNWF